MKADSIIYSQFEKTLFYINTGVAEWVCPKQAGGSLGDRVCRHDHRLETGWALTDRHEWLIRTEQYQQRNRNGRLYVPEGNGLNGMGIH